jgi:hypothetical protein
MMEKIIHFKISKPEHYIRLFNGIYGLTMLERTILAEFILIHLMLEKIGSDVNPFCPDMKRRVAKRLGKPNFGTLNNSIKAIKDKGAISKVSGGYKIHPNLLPAGENQIVFKIK